MTYIVPKCSNGVTCACDQAPDACTCNNANCTIECRVKTGIATMIGFQELTNPSTPPKTYLIMTMSGGMSGNAYSDPACATGIGTRQDNVSGVCSYDAATGILTNSTNDSVNINGTITNSMLSCAIFGSAVGITQVLTSTTETRTGSGACVNAGPNFTIHNGVSTVTLSHEDTEDNAIERAAAVWSDWAPLSADNPCCAGIEPRTGFSFHFTKVQYRAKTTGVPGSLVSVDVNFSRRLYGVGAYALYLTLPRTVQIKDDGIGETEAADVPNDYGYQTCPSCVAKPFDAFA